MTHKLRNSRQGPYSLPTKKDEFRRDRGEERNRNKSSVVKTHKRGARETREYPHTETDRRKENSMS